MPYQPEIIEPKWQRRWAERRTNEPDLDQPDRPFYNLMMFPYPSAEGLHVGNFYAFTGSDVYGRFKRLQGHKVFEPIGFDAFGIHSENFALKLGVNPGVLIPQNIENFTRQLVALGGMFDWKHAVATTDPAYYKWTQWVFLKLFEAGKAYRKKAAVNWCPSCKTVLANEQVEGGACERCGTIVEQRSLEQWFFRITEYAERLLEHLDDPAIMDWSGSTTAAQRNWIGRSEGAEIDFATSGSNPIRVFTTRADTIFGATAIVLAPEHPAVTELTQADQRGAVLEYVRNAAAKDLVSRKVGDKEKSGVFTGAYATNPATGEEVPIWVADYVMMDYGTGAIMAVPGHDERDFAFAGKHGIPIVRVVAGPEENESTSLPGPLPEVEGGRLVNSGEFSGRPVEEGAREIVTWLEDRGVGRALVKYRIHDWCISRQRYWGPPIPIIHCDRCGPVAVPESDLPVLLPEIDDFRPDDSGVSPLARHTEWYHVACPNCGGKARRETDVSDTFLDSGWYFLRYPSTEFSDRPFDRTRLERWMPIPMYIGGNEHAVLHLLYARFITMVLHDLGYLPFEEPFRRFRAHGLIVKDGAKMSKSRGNVVVPDEYIAKYGADTLRLFLMFLGPFEEGGDFRESGITGPRRFLERLSDLVEQCERQTLFGNELHREIVVKWNATKKKVTQDLESLGYNTAIAAQMELLNAMRESNCTERRIVKDMIVMVAPFAPHFAEECWERLGHTTSVFDVHWPDWEEGLTVDFMVDLVVQVNGRTRGLVKVRRGASEPVVRQAAEADSTVKRFLDGKTTRKVIFVPDRLINLVTD